MSSIAKDFVGVDVSKATLDGYRPDIKEVFKIEKSDEAIALLCSHRPTNLPTRRFVAQVA